MGDYIEEMFKDIQTTPSKTEEIVRVVNTILENFANIVFNAVETMSKQITDTRAELKQTITSLNTKIQTLEGRLSSMSSRGPTGPTGPTPGSGGTDPFLKPPPTAPSGGTEPTEPFLKPPPTGPGSSPTKPESPQPVTGATLRSQLNSELKKAFSRMRGGSEE